MSEIGYHVVRGLVAALVFNLGALFLSGQINSDYPLMFTVLIVLLGIVFYYAVVAIERIFAGWAEREAQ